jgi:hypothetical protein
VACWKAAGRLQPLPGGPYATAREAAARVAEKYREEYGENWPAAVRARRSNPWAVEVWHRVVKRGGKVRRVPAGWVVAVWEWGRCVYLGDHLHPTRPRLDWAVARRPWVFASKAEAVAGLRRWRAVGLTGRWGLLAPYALYR